MPSLSMSMYNNDCTLLMDFTCDYQSFIFSSWSDQNASQSDHSSNEKTNYKNIATHVWSKPSGWKQGSHPKFLGPLGSTIFPFE